ncbi:MAG: DUF4376 domain-containing protein [Salinarimonadaceae bacterium]|nr:MAG: DUF4376 domain-containing protein [Salinarimonadaceae bacterium]
MPELYKMVNGQRIAMTPDEVAAFEASQPGPEPLDAYAARRRWEIETGGIVVGGAAVRTDRESQALINGALSLVQTDPTATIEFKGAEGWSTLDAAQMTAIALAVGRHVQKAFSAERTISEAIAAQEITTIEEVDAAFAALMAP